VACRFALYSYCAAPEKGKNIADTNRWEKSGLLFFLYSYCAAPEKGKNIALTKK
jgi:hypothetical protein